MRRCFAQAVFVVALRASLSAAYRAAAGEFAPHTDALSAHTDATDVYGVFAVFCNAGGLGLLLGEAGTEAWAALAASCPAGRAPAIQALVSVGMAHANPEFVECMVQELEEQAVAVALLQPSLLADCVAGFAQGIDHRNPRIRTVSVAALGALASSGAIGGSLRECVVNLLVGVLGDSDTFVREIAASTLGQVGVAVAYDGALLEVIVDSLARTLGDSHIFVREASVKVLGRVGAMEGIDRRLREVIMETLAHALFDHNSNVARSAARALEFIGSLDAIDQDARTAIVGELVRGMSAGDMSLSRASAYALGQIGSIHAVGGRLRQLIVESLALAMRDRTGNGPGFQAARALGAIGTSSSVDGRQLERVVEHLARGCRNFAGDVRRSSAHALGDICARRAGVGGLQDLMSEQLARTLHDPVADVRVEAISALESVAPIIAVDGGTRRVIVEMLGRALGDDSAAVRRRAAEALGVICSKAALDNSLRGLILNNTTHALNDVDSRVRESAAVTLAKIGLGAGAVVMHRTIVEALAPALNDSAFVVRTASARALRELGTDPSIDSELLGVIAAHLTQALGDRISSVRGASAQGLGMIGSTYSIGSSCRELAVGSLRQALDDTDVLVRRASILALASIRRAFDLRLDKAITEALLVGLADPDDLVRSTSAGALAETGAGRIGGRLHETIVEKLALAINDTSTNVAQALAGSELVVVRMRLLEALGKAGSIGMAGRRLRQAVVIKLAEGLRDTDLAVCSISIDALAELGSAGIVHHQLLEVIVQELAQALSAHHGPIYRSRVVRALGKIGGVRRVEDGLHETIVQTLTQALGDADSDVISASVTALAAIGCETANVATRGRIVDELLQAFDKCAPEHGPGVMASLSKLGAVLPTDSRELLAIVRHLVRALVGSVGSHVRSASAKTLGEIGMRGVGRGMLESIVVNLARAISDRHSEVRWQSAQAIGKVASLEALGSRLQRLSSEKLARGLNDRCDFVRESSTHALGRIGTASAVDGRLHADIVKMLTRSLGDHDAVVRTTAVTALVEVGIAVPIEHGLRRTIAEELSKCCCDRDVGVRERTMKALGKLGSVGAACGSGFSERIVEQLTQAINRDASAGSQDDGLRSRLVVSVLGMGSAGNVDRRVQL